MSTQTRSHQTTTISVPVFIYDEIPNLAFVILFICFNGLLQCCFRSASINDIVSSNTQVEDILQKLDRVAHA